MNKIAGFILNLQRDRLKNTKENVVSCFFAFYAMKYQQALF